MPDTVLTVAALGGNDMTKWMKGWAKRDKKTIVKVPSASDLDPETIPKSALALDELVQIALRYSTGIVYILAHSQGCQIVGEWLQDYAGAHDKSRIRIILTGNLERKYFGYIARKPWFIGSGNSVRTTPEDSGIEITDIGRQGDLWANYPGGLKSILKLFLNPPHLNYDSVDPDSLDPRHLVKRAGNTSYYTVP